MCGLDRQDVYTQHHLSLAATLGTFAVCVSLVLIAESQFMARFDWLKTVERLKEIE